MHRDGEVIILGLFIAVMAYAALRAWWNLTDARSGRRGRK
jgi:hypothetical protein